ncbi:MAG TPA: type I restriction enzyme HsdR N-terminal domain-containing protein [Bacteroidia bacterium]|nr:type I restriction enzyme HsdR N-terminal domain-containing protein [Bacteroidia bacterium]
MFSPLNFPAVKLRLREEKTQTQVFDVIRKKYVLLTPEEWVRQHVICFLVEEKKFPRGLIEVEKQILLFNTNKRVDILVRDKSLKPLLLVECKAADVILKQNEINQLARYQITLQAPYCMLTNGINHVVMKLKDEKVTFLQELPFYQEI